MKTMSKEAESRIISAAEHVADYVADGSSPDDAVIKVAREMNVPSGHLHLLVNAYNTGRTAVQREEGEDALAKAASFELASYANIVNALYPATVKTAAVAAQTDEVSPEYREAPTWYGNVIMKRAASRVKTAAAVTYVPEARPLNTEPDSELNRAIHRLERRKLAMDESRRVATNAEVAFSTTLDELEQYFRKAGSLSISDVRENVELLYGKPGLAVLDSVGDRTPMLKKASTARLHAVHEDQSPYKEVIAGVRHAVEYGVAWTQHLRAHKQAWAESLEDMEPFNTKTAAPTKGLSQGVGQGLAFGLVHKALGEPYEEDDPVARQVSRIATPDHEQALRDIETKALFHELLHSDPVISGHDPHHVASLYNRVSRTAPTVARHPLSAIPVMRKSLEQGSLDPFDVQQIVSTEQSLRSLHNPSAQGGSHGKAAG